MPEVLLHVFHVGAFAADASGGFGVGVIAFAAEFVYDVEPGEGLGVACGKAFLNRATRSFLSKSQSSSLHSPVKGFTSFMALIKCHQCGNDVSSEATNARIVR